MFITRFPLARGDTNGGLVDAKLFSRCGIDVDVDVRHGIGGIKALSPTSFSA